MKSQIKTNNVNSTELWVELDEQQSSELVGGTLGGLVTAVTSVVVPINNLTTQVGIVNVDDTLNGSLNHNQIGNGLLSHNDVNVLSGCGC